MQGLGDKFEVGSGGLFPENLDRGIAKRSQMTEEEPRLLLIVRSLRNQRLKERELSGQCVRKSRSIPGSIEIPLSV